MRKTNERMLHRVEQITHLLEVHTITQMLKYAFVNL